MKIKIGSEKLYNKIYPEVDRILNELGIKKICLVCSTIKPFNKEGRELGCCNRCKYLTINGCSTKSIYCKFWLCSEELKDKIKYSKYKRKWNKLLYKALKNNFFGFRGSYEDVKYEKCLIYKKCLIREYLEL